MIRLLVFTTVCTMPRTTFSSKRGALSSLLLNKIALLNKLAIDQQDAEQFTTDPPTIRHASATHKPLDPLTTKKKILAGPISEGGSPFQNSSTPTHDKKMVKSKRAYKQNADGHAYIGLAALVVAIIGFGTQTVPVKMVKAAGKLAVIFYFSLGAGLAGIALMPFLAHQTHTATAQLTSTPPPATAVYIDVGVHLTAQQLISIAKRGRAGVYVAMAYAPGKILQLWAVKRVGVGLSTGTGIPQVLYYTCIRTAATYLYILLHATCLDL
jgi:hypothetical protein